jgi:hypothetical protein
MSIRLLNITLFVLAGLLWSAEGVFAQENKEDRHIRVAIRMIGHEILLRSGDSVSRVLPVEKEGDRYKLRFESDFQFVPDELVSVIDSVVMLTRIAKSYLVEIEECQTLKVVYSYEIGNSFRSDVVPCRERIQPNGCYNLLFTILIAGNPELSLPATQSDSSVDYPAAKRINYLAIILLVVALFVAIGLIIFYRKKTIKPISNPDVISLGSYQFDKRNMKLSSRNEIIELTSKESDLLYLLVTSVNNTIGRDVILNTVWGDEGVYDGRTLDVFISKLRKKLEADSSLKIVNIRGVGYKLIVNN